MSMRGPTYSEADLFALKDSPLVKKPDGLPSISQWMDVPADQNTNNGHTNNNGTVRRARGMRDGEGATTTEQRPMINPMGQFGRRQSMRKSPEAQGIKAAINALFVEPGEETVLGPPKLAFLSARQVKPTGETKERTGITSTDGDNVGDRFPKNERWTRDRENDRTRDKGYTNGRRAGREDGEAGGWQNVKGRKSIGQEDFERFTRNGDRNREKHEGDAETDVAPRRGNRERNEPRWGRREEGKEEGTKAGVQGGWRDRDRERERDNGREWNRGGNRAEEDPEWMDTKAEKKEFKPRTQEDFQRWKEQMRAKDTPAEDKDEPREAPPVIPTAIGITAPPMLTAPLHTPTTEPTQGILFGNWGRDKSEDMSPAETMSAKPKTEKKSRFMTMFAKAEEPAVQTQPPAPTPASPAPAPEANADKEGFQRILQMLGQVGLPPPQPSMAAPTNGTRPGGGVSLDFHQQSPPPEPQHGRPPPRTMEQQSILENILAPRPAAPESRSSSSQQARFASMSPDNGLPEQFRLPRPESNQPRDVFPHPPPPRNNPQDANLAAILSSRAREESQRDDATKQRERDFLLNLMQQPTRATPPQTQNLARPVQENHNMAFFEQHRQQPQQLQQPPKGRGGFPPGLMEDPRMYAENDMMRRDDRREQLELRQIQQIQQQQDAMRAKNQRMPMGYPNEDPLMGLQRRNTGGDPRMPTNMGIPSQPLPDMQYMGGRGQQGMPPTPQERPNIAPPPGFGGLMRQPPGLGGPNTQQMGPGGPSFSTGNTPLGHPPGFPPGGSIRGLGGFPGGPGGVPAGNGMQGPPGYFPPPGYGGPLMPSMRGGDDPRMMFDAQFGGPPRQQPGRGLPPNMY
jgi:hypothetical protein